MREKMKCAFCDAEWDSDQDGSTNWGAMDVGGRRFYFCPKERPPDGAPAEEFKKAKARMQARAIELLENEPEPKYQVCGCTELTPCIGSGEPCHWIAPGVLCSACLDKVEMPATAEALASAMSPLMDLELPLQLPGLAAFQLLAALQLLCRHPEFSGTTREFVEEFGHWVQGNISLTPQIAKITESGWMPELDVPAKGRLLLPGRDFR